MTETTIEQVQTCKTCGNSKPLSDYYVRKETGRHRKECKACRNEKTKEWAASNPEKRKAILAKSELKNKEANAARRSAWKKANRDKLNEQQRAWRAANPDRNKAYGRAAYWRNPERGRQMTRDWYRRNRDYAIAWASGYAKRQDVRDRLSAYRKHRMKNDPAYAINHRMRQRLRDTLRTSGITKGGRSWVSLVGYTTDELRQHIEAQFLKGMGWHNMHLWEIDHIVPLADFKIKEVGDKEFRAAWGLGNLRPLWMPENRSKSDKRVFLL